MYIYIYIYIYIINMLHALLVTPANTFAKYFLCLSLLLIACFFHDIFFQQSGHTPCF